jgi:DNA-binding MarR family transcriptional regulator
VHLFFVSAGAEYPNQNACRFSIEGRTRAGGFVQEKPLLHLVSVRQSSSPEPPLKPGFRSAEDARAGVSRDPVAPSAHDSELVTIELSSVEVAALRRVLAIVEDAEMKDADPERSGKAIAQTLFGLSKARAQLFPKSMFGEPAWDMMMALYIAEQVPAAADLARWTDTALTTAMRWISYLESHKLVVRESRDDDRRAHTIRLSDEAREKMAELFSGFAKDFS